LLRGRNAYNQANVVAFLAVAELLVEVAAGVLGNGFPGPTLRDVARNQFELACRCRWSGVAVISAFCVLKELPDNMMGAVPEVVDLGLKKRRQDLFSEFPVKVRMRSLAFLPKLLKAVKMLATSALPAVEG
jgi:hypothetical protein